MNWLSGSALGRRGLEVAPADAAANDAAIARLRSAIDTADAILVGAGAGLSAAAGLTYGGDRFNRLFPDFRDRFGIGDMYSGGLFPFPDEETYWAYWSRLIWANRYGCPVGELYRQLLELLRGQDYFVITTNVDHQFQRAEFPKDRLFYTQGDYGLFQCSRPCRQETYGNRAAVERMVERQAGMRVPSELVPRCPCCGRRLVPNLRADDTFVEGEGWHAARDRYLAWRKEHGRGSVLYLELGVGGNTPVIIKFPFWEAVQQNARATYACLNMGEAFAPLEIAGRSILVNADLAAAVASLMRP